MYPSNMLRVAAVVLFLVTGMSHPLAAAELFPMPDVIAPNVSFWIKVYAEYSTGQGIIHDQDDLTRIYDVIDLIPYDVEDNEAINRARINLALARYRSILHRLGNEPDCADEECRRVAALFEKGMDPSGYTLAAGRVRCQIGQKDRFRTGLIRSGAYLDQIRSIFRSYGLPEDLAYLPHAESSFNPNAYSKFGAAGMWQFTRSTGRRFMEVGYVLDERRDPILSTHAAARLLIENYEKLGNWPLAITAYNHGAAGMEQAKRLHGDFARIYQRYYSGTFKFASRNFYAEFLAARQVAIDYPSFFGELTLDRPAPVVTVVLDGFASFADLCRHFSIDPQTLRQMNPALRPPVFSGQKLVPKGYALHLPADPANPVIASAVVPDSIYEETQLPSLFYTVQRGDTVAKIARKHNIDVQDLILANHLDRRATIHPRQTLRIPGHYEQITAALSASQPVETAASKTPAGPENPESRGDQPDGARAQDPPPLLAAIVPFGMELGSVPPAENLQERSSPAQHAQNDQIVTAEIRFENLAQEQGRKIGILRVEVEETLGHYGEWAGVHTQSIRNLNGIQFGSVLHLHQKIKIPLHRVDAATFEQSRYEYHKRLQEDFFAVYRVGELKDYRVNRGDTFWKICRERFDIPMWLLKHVNPEVDLADLRAGLSLNIPLIVKASPDDADPGFAEEATEEDGVLENRPGHRSGAASVGNRRLTEKSQIPLIGTRIMAQDVNPVIIPKHLEIAVIGR